MLRINSLQSAMIRPPERAMMAKPDYAGMNLVQLRQELRKRGFSVTGNKPELIKRLEGD